MKKLIIISIVLLSFANGHFLKAQSTLGLVESSGGCVLTTDCENEILCFDIMLTPVISADIKSYNIWVHYPGTNLNYVSDNSCVADNGNDNNLDGIRHYRVSGVNGEFTVTAGATVSIHTICFSYPDIDSIASDDLTVGGALFGSLLSPITYENPVFNEPALGEFPFEINSTTVSCVLLPVKWLNFQAAKSGSHALLNWTTADEFNNAGFEVERSQDGQKFEKIGFVPVAAVSKPVLQYQFTDTRPFTGMNYYRIRQLDLDGKAGYSPVRTVVFGDNQFNASIWPNPSNGLVNIEIDLDENEDIQVRVINSTGELVFTREYTAADLQSGLELSHLMPGVYTVLIASDHNDFSGQIVIIK